MAEQPKREKERKEKASRLVELIDPVFQRKSDRRMTKRARCYLRSALEAELRHADDNDAKYETGTSSLDDAAENFVALAAGSLELKAPEDVSPSPTVDSLKGYTKVGVAAIKHAVDKARAYREKTKVCPVWPF